MGKQDKNHRMRELLMVLADDPSALEIARIAIENELIEWRDSRLSMPGRGNGLVAREKNGAPSHIIRFGPEVAVRIALRAIAESRYPLPPEETNLPKETA